MWFFDYKIRQTDRWTYKVRFKSLLQMKTDDFKFLQIDKITFQSRNMVSSYSYL